MSRVLLLQGNQAVVEGAIAAGVKFYGGYPITPSTETVSSPPAPGRRQIYADGR